MYDILVSLNTKSAFSASINKITNLSKTAGTRYPCSVLPGSGGRSLEDAEPGSAFFTGKNPLRKRESPANWTSKRQNKNILRLIMAVFSSDAQQ